MSENLNQRALLLPVFDSIERPYQARILQRCAVENTIICLPAGFGKAFIAHALMLNMCRWFPEKIVLFCAPTRASVSRQCTTFRQYFSNFMSSISEVNINLSPDKRLEHWNGQGIFFSTVSIVESDIKNDLLDPQRIICLIFQDAHYAADNLSYSNIMQALRQSSASVRICALTATPGSGAESIQKLISTFDIEAIEYLNENSPELEPFILAYDKEIIDVESNYEIESVCMLLDNLIFENYIKPLRRFNLHFPEDVNKILLASMLNIDGARENGSPVEWHLSGLRMLIYIRDLLLSYGIICFKSYLHTLASSKPTPSKSRVLKDLSSHTRLRDFLDNLEHQIQGPGFVSHPKLALIRKLILGHFSCDSTDSKVVIYSQHPDSLCEIFAILDKLSPTINPVIFVNQPRDRLMRQSLANYSQIAKDFQKGMYNVLLCNCAREDRLDIGEVDLIIYYDVQQSPTKIFRHSGGSTKGRIGKVIFFLYGPKEKNALELLASQTANLEAILSTPDGRFRFSIQQEKNPARLMPSVPVPMKVKMAMPEFKSEPKSKKIKTEPSFNILVHSYIKTKPLSAQLHSWTLSPSHRIAHSELNTSLFNMLNRSSSSSTNSLHLSECRTIWNSLIKNQKPMQLYNYIPNSLSSYVEAFNSCMKFSRCAESTASDFDSLPEEFFEDIKDLDLSDSPQSLNTKTTDLSFPLSQFDWIIDDL